MIALKTGLVVGILLAQLVTWANIGGMQTSHPLQSRIPKPDPKKYDAIRDGKDWKNPVLVVRPEGIEVVGITPTAQAIPAESVPDKLEHLPDSAWPYGLIVVVSDTGIVSSAKVLPLIQANRTKLLKILKAHGIAVDLWPSAKLPYNRHFTQLRSPSALRRQRVQPTGLNILTTSRAS